MKLRDSHTPAVAAAKAGFSTASAYSLEKDLRLRPREKPARGRRRPDPLVDIWDSEIVPLLRAAPGLRSVAIFEEMNRRHPKRRRSEGSDIRLAHFAHCAQPSLSAGRSSGMKSAPLKRSTTCLAKSMSFGKADG